METGALGEHLLAIVQLDSKKELGFAMIHLQEMAAISVSGTLQSLMVVLQHV